MPAISMFYGIIVYMYYMDNRQHKMPHIHVKYQEHEVVLSIPDGKILQGSLPRPKMKLVVAWIELRKDELLADWELAVTGQELYKIDPLRWIMNPRVTKVETTKNYKLILQFSNGESGIYDCGPILEFGVFKELKNIAYFDQAYVLDGTVAWPHDQDICPDTLYLDSIKTPEKALP